ncbi:MAG: class I SAM-dependent RNA methyltransferase [Acidobacteria bacterium]|nr:class I SAM-dependent RNA methyltransferase [Acidobacteriota bacterium]
MGPLASSEPITLRVEKLVQGGYGLAHQGGQAILLPGVLPDEDVEVRRIHRGKNAAWGEVTQVLTANPHRRTPPCPYYGVCGGCDLQHAEYGYQVELKVEALRETLARIGGLDWRETIPVTPSPEFGYRMRAQLKVARVAGQVRVGFFARESHEICPIDRCLLLPDHVNAFLPILVDRLKRIRGVETIDILTGTANDLYLRVQIKGTPKTSVVDQLLSTPGCAGVLVTGAGGHPTRVGREYAVIDVGHDEYAASPECFFQVNRHLHASLIESLERELPASGKMALDLYCGAGFFTLPLARRFDHCIGVEENAASLRLARVAARARSNIRLVAGTAESFLTQLPADSRPDLVLMDPPRGGIPESVACWLREHLPQNLVYFSCEPATFARDLRRITGAGRYELVSLRAFDLFPQTHDIEVMARLRAVRTAP